MTFNQKEKGIHDRWCRVAGRLGWAVLFAGRSYLLDSVIPYRSGRAKPPLRDDAKPLSHQGRRWHDQSFAALGVYHINPSKQNEFTHMQFE